MHEVPGAGIADFIDYWQHEGEAYARRGDYDWMALQVPAGSRVLEIGCGVGFGTAALLGRGATVLAVDCLEACLEATRLRTTSTLTAPDFLLADILTLSDAEHAVMKAFVPETVVCWLMGAPAGMIGASRNDAGQAVAHYRESLHRQVAEIAASLPSVRFLHYVDRTAIPWQGKDVGRDTLVRYHAGKTLLDLPFLAERRRALYRKLEGNVVDLAEVRRSHPSLKSVVPTLASLLVERKS